MTGPLRISALAALAFAVIAPMRSAMGQRSGTAERLTGKVVSCRVDGADEPLLCGRREVFEDRAARAGRTISLNIVVLPATTDSVLDDPLVYFAGGGVVPATRFARYFSREFRALRRHRDIVLVDQRGTGGSNALSCDRSALDTATSLPPDQRFLKYVAACRASLADRADVRLYTTSTAMDDLEDVRAWLGYPVLNLYGSSYGTSAAAVYLRRYPSHVRTVVMHGVVPLDVPMQLDLPRSAQEALDRVLRLCEQDDSCRRRYPTVRADLGALLARFDSLSHTGTPNAGQPFRELLSAALSGASPIRTIPLLIRDAWRGGSLADLLPVMPAPAPLGVRLAILCSEGLAQLDTTSIAQKTAATFLGAFPVRFQLRWCDGWPVAPLPPGFRAPVRSHVPALLLTGELDPITPPAYAERVAASLTRSTVLTLPYRSHNDTDACVVQLIESFVVSGGSSPDTGCLARTPPLRFMDSR